MKQFISIRSLLCALFLLSQATVYSITLEIVPQFEGATLRADSLRYSTSQQQTISVERLAFLLSGFGLQKADGSWWQYPEENLAFLELSPPRLKVDLPAAPEGQYLGVRFDVGLPKTINHLDPAQYASDHPLSPTLNALHWTWADGYIFLAIEGKYRHQKADTGLSGYALHMGNDWTRTSITLASEFDHGARLAIPFNISKLFRFPESIDFQKHGHTTHSRSKDDVLALKLKSNLTAAFGKPLRLESEKSVQAIVEKLKPLHLPISAKGYPFAVKRHFPRPDLPADNPLLISRVQLGKSLFFDKIMSADNQVSCSSCHLPDQAFSDSRKLSLGINQQPGFRHSMPLFNLAWRNEFFWDGRAQSLREQVLDPITDPKELGNENVDQLIERLAASDVYPAAFKAAFGDASINEETISLALENFLLSITSQDSPFDRAMRGEGELSKVAKRGFELFFTEYEPRMGQFGADCFHCHGGALFTDNRFRNNGLALLNDDFGREQVTGKSTDRGKFLVPSLRNVALTAPYMHDGRFSNLSEVIDHYRTGVNRSATLDANLAKHPAPGIPISDSDKLALIAFLESLSDPAFSKLNAKK